MSHSLFSPSSAETWMTCAGSVALTQDAPREASRYSAEGTAAHTLAARALTYDRNAAFFLGEQIEADGYVFTVDSDMVAAVQFYLDDVRSRSAGGVGFFEQRVSFSETVGYADQAGTADYICVTDDNTHLTIADLKYGMGVKVFAQGNRQLLTYAAAVLETYGAILENIQRVTVVINQPRLEHLDEHTYALEEVQAHATAMRAAVDNAKVGLAAHALGEEIPSNLFVPSENGCRWCKAAATCPALKRFVSKEVFDGFEDLDNPEGVLVQPAPEVPATGDQLGATFGVLDIIETWCRAVRAEVERRVFGGMTVIGPDGEPMKLVEGKRGNRAWTDEEMAKAALAGLLPVDEYAPRKIVTPAQAEKKLGKKRKADYDNALAALVVQAPGRPKITLGSDPAPAYNPAAGACEFEDISAEVA